jgi:hypothetical protein
MAKKESLKHSPTLTTVIMVEKTLRDAKQLVTLAELKQQLPRKVMHGTLISILDYLQYSGKIIIGTKGILWVYMPREDIKKLIKRGLSNPKARQ